MVRVFDHGHVGRVPSKVGVIQGVSLVAIESRKGVHSADMLPMTKHHAMRQNSS